MNLQVILQLMVSEIFEVELIYFFFIKQNLFLTFVLHLLMSLRH